MKDRHGLIGSLRFKPKYMSYVDYAFTITTHASYRPTDNYIIVPKDTKEGYALVEVGDGVYTNRCQSKKEVVQKSMIPTLKTSVNDIGVVDNDKDEFISISWCYNLMGN